MPNPIISYQCDMCKTTYKNQEWRSIDMICDNCRCTSKNSVGMWGDLTKLPIPSINDTYKLTADQQIRIAALSSAVPAWIHKCQMTMHADFKPVDLWEIVAEFEEYIRTGEMK